ncbi:MAG TPA: hypothetical protein VMH00_08170 [Candidatus Limnocylindrales bacterium]|nr:hypothetical protein [Candidatus Limnocylindrales bacterium]
MIRAIAIFVMAGLVSGGAAKASFAQSHPDPKATSPAASEGGERTIDGIAARIEDDVITTSEVRELGAFQKLVDGRAKSRDEIIRELADQWIVRQEALATNYSTPSDEEVEHAYDALVKQFPSAEKFQEQCAAVDLSQAAVRRLLRDQLYLSRFLDFRFRAAAQVDQQQIEDYYQNEFVPQLKARGENVPPLEDVEDTIREVLVQRAIDARSAKWLEDTRERLKIDIAPAGDDQ